MEPSGKEGYKELSQEEIKALKEIARVLFIWSKGVSRVDITGEGITIILDDGREIFYPREEKKEGN